MSLTPRLCPRQFGHPNRRLRVWRILYNKDLKKWIAPFSLGELANIILAPVESSLHLSFKAYMWATPADKEGKSLKEDELSRCINYAISKAHGDLIQAHTNKSIPVCVLCRCQQKHLRLFRGSRPDKQLYDLSANPTKRCRTETIDRCMPCLTTSSQFWSPV